MTEAKPALLRLEVHGPQHASPDGHDWYEDTRLTVYDADLNAQTLVRNGLELQPIITWLRANELNIRNDLPPLDQRPGETIGETLRRAYAAIPEDLPDDLDYIAQHALHQYNSKHNFKFAARGMKMDTILLGKGAYGTEVCNWIYDDTDTSWRYIFDADDFFGNLPAG